MSKYRSARAVLAGAAVIALAGCASASTSSPATGGPGTTTAAGATSTPAAGSTSASPGTPSGQQGALAAGASVPFPVTVGNTWVYQTVTGNENGSVTNRVMSVTPVPGGRRVTMSSAVALNPHTSTTRLDYMFYADGKIGYPVNQSGGVSVLGGSGVLWPNAAELASGQAYHSVLQVRLNTTGSIQAASVTVQGGGTQAVTVPAGTYQATVVNTTMLMNVGNFTSTVLLTTWDAAGIGPVKTEETIKASGKATVITTEELLTFTKG